MVGGNIGIHHRLDGFLLGIAVLVEIIVIHIEGTVTFEAEAVSLGAASLFLLCTGIEQGGSVFIYLTVLTIPQFFGKIY